MLSKHTVLLSAINRLLLPCPLVFRDDSNKGLLSGWKTWQIKPGSFNRSYLSHGMKPFEFEVYAVPAPESPGQQDGGYATRTLLFELF